MGVILATAMFAAPVEDLRSALTKGELGNLNPFPWVMTTGNCLGWVAYGYVTTDPFVLAANVPGLVVSIWLNSGAAKLQYQQLRQDVASQVTVLTEQWDASPALEYGSSFGSVAEADVPQSNTDRMNGKLILVDQERQLLTILSLWAVVLVWVGWLSPNTDSATAIGIVVNANLIFFYGAPLNTMKIVIQTRNSATIHAPTMIMNWINTSFWILYGLVRRDAVIVLPNAIGLSLGLVQGLLCLLFPRTGQLATSTSLMADAEAIEAEAGTNEDDVDADGSA